MSDEFQDLWQAQNPEPFHMSLEEIRKKAEKLQKRVRRRNAREYIASFVALGALGAALFSVHDLFRQIGSALLIAGLLYIVYHLRTRGAAREITGDCLEFHRHELERQRDLLTSVWKWYLAPMIPGLLVIGLRALWQNRLGSRFWFGLAYFGGTALLFYAVGRLNQRGARCLQRQIDELDRLR